MPETGSRTKVAFVFNRQRSKALEEAEFDTPEVIDAITNALRQRHEVIQIEMTKNGSWIRKLEDCQPDVILNTAEGFRGIGRESLAPICFEQLGLHYAGPGSYQCFLTLDKYLTKQLVRAAGVLTPESHVVHHLDDLPPVLRELTFPVFAKPNFEGSSKGIDKTSICSNPRELKSYLSKKLRHFTEGILVEKYVDGKDVTVPFISNLGDEGVLEPVEYFRTDFEGNWIYDYDLKNTDDSKVQVRCPAKLEPPVLASITAAMKKVVGALSIVDMARADFRVTPTGEVYFIEINALPSLQPGAGIFEASKNLGLGYDETILHIVASALARKSQSPVKSPRRIKTKKPNIALVYNVKTRAPSDPDYELESEFDSPETIQAIGNAIRENGFDLIGIEMNRNLADELLSARADIVFNIAEGFQRRTREAQVPALCDLLGIEHTGGDATCLAITLDKEITNKLMAAEGILVPRSQVIRKMADLQQLQLNYPIIAKPVFEGTSKGIYENSVASSPDELQRAVQRLGDSISSGILCEEYVAGREFTVGVLGTESLRILGPSEIVFKDRGDNSPPFPVYSFEAKQAPDPVNNEYFEIRCPADISEAMDLQVRRFARRCFRIVQCRDVARIDFRITANGDIYFIEINPLPGLSPGFSDLSILADKTGMSYTNLVGSILKPAVRRWRRNQVRA